MNEYQYHMAFIDWDKYGGSFRNLRQHPNNLIGCVYTMLNEFQQKDLLKSLPNDAPWDSIQQIQSLGRQAIQVTSQGGELDSHLDSELRRHCYLFCDWAENYFSSTTPPWQRRTEKQSATPESSSGGCGCGTFITLIAVGYAIYFGYTWFEAQSKKTESYSSSTSAPYSSTGLPMPGSRSQTTPRAPEPREIPSTPSPSENATTPTSIDRQLRLTWTKRQDTKFGTAFEIEWNSEGSAPLKMTINDDPDRSTNMTASGNTTLFVSRKARFQLSAPDGASSPVEMTLEPDYNVATEPERAEEGPPLTLAVDLVANFADELNFRSPNSNNPLEKFLAEQFAQADKATLRIYRNAIPASIGYTFKDQSLASLFESRPWYVSRNVPGDDLDSLYSARQKANAEFIVSLEEKRR